MKDIGEMAEYIGCKNSWDWSSRSMTMMQSVKIQRFEDEYDHGITKDYPLTPLEAGVVLRKEGEGKNYQVLDNTEQKAY